MINFLIWTPEYQKNSGGVIALHKLANDLNALGERAYLYTSYKNPEWGGELYNGQNLDLEKTFVIYPEIICGNPLGYKHVVRWILNTPGAVGGDGIYTDDDLIFKYCDFFKAPNENKVIGNLRTLDARVDFWSENLNKQRNGECYLIRKGGNKILDKHGVGAINIDYYADNEQLRNILSQKEVCISYDSETFVSVQAAMAGCLSIVVPRNDISAKEWRNGFPQHKFGISYGFSKEEINHAKITRHLVADHIRELEKNSQKTVKNFVRICKEKVNG